jgi:hypothetical protein
MALKGEIIDNELFRWLVVETKCECCAESLSVEMLLTDGKLDIDDIFFVLETARYSFKDRLKEAFKGKTRREIVVGKEEFLDFVGKLNEIAEIVRKEAK